jgi:WD40 repeat protein
MLYISFNQDATCFSCSNDNGFVVYNCDPFTKRFNRISNNNDNNGIRIIEMLFKTNIFVIVGGGKFPKYPINKVIIWDDFQVKCLAELEFKYPITNVKLRKDIILISLFDKSYLYSFSDLKLIKVYNTFNNSSGISSITFYDNIIIALPDINKGTVLIDNITNHSTISIQAHKNSLAFISLNYDGKLLATASDKGTLIRLWNTITGDLIKEFRRGIDHVSITNIFFNKDTSKLCVSSNKDTLHIYNLNDINATSTENDNKKSKFYFLKNYLPKYFSSEWSCISFTIPSNSVCRFSNNDYIYVITIDGLFLKYAFNSHNNIYNCIESISFI